MLFTKYRGKRIKPDDTNLLLKKILSIFILLWSLFYLVLNFSQIRLVINHHVGVMSLFTKESAVKIIIGAIIAAVLMITVFFLQKEKIKYILKDYIFRQKIARMMIDNGLYDSDTSGNQLFKDFSLGKDLNITYFPKVYYSRKKSLLTVQVEICMKSYQDQLESLENKLESGLFCECIKKELKDGYMEYMFIYNMLEERISIDEVNVTNGALKLMKSVSWEFDKLPHQLISGGTGSGKTYYILTLIECLLRSNSEMVVLDPKNADLADLATVMPNVYYKKEDIVAQVNKFYENMLECSANMKLHPKYRTGKNYAYIGFPPHFLIFDEYVAFMEMLSSKEQADVLSKLKQIVMLGRQAGYFLIVACQRPDAKYFGDGIRDQFNFRVALGRMSDVGYGMMFQDVTKKFYLKEIKGRGYLDNSTSVVTEFYTPTIPQGHDFLKTIGELSKKRLLEVSACGAEAGTESEAVHNRPEGDCEAPHI